MSILLEFMLHYVYYSMINKSSSLLGGDGCNRKKKRRLRLQHGTSYSFKWDGQDRTLNRCRLGKGWMNVRDLSMKLSGVSPEVVLVVQNLPANAGDSGDPGSIPGL